MAEAADSLTQQRREGEIKPDERERGNTRSYWRVGIAVWIIGFVVLVIVSMIVHAHPRPWPFELDVTKLLQGPRPVPCNYRVVPHLWLDQASDLLNQMNDPLPSLVVPLVIMAGLALFRLFWQALFVGVAALGSSTIWGGINFLVGRPRMTPAVGVCVHRVVTVYSFPSGHVMHDVVFYGFLLYLTFSKPLREWRYRWIIYPLQVLLVLYMLAIGYTRLEAGEHMLVDVLGAYLAGILCLVLCIWLYRWTLHMWAEHRAKSVTHA
jgi:membrane-associated phospholipid phosphatase